jgi:hypothetical protein
MMIISALREAVTLVPNRAGGITNEIFRWSLTATFLLERTFSFANLVSSSCQGPHEKTVGASSSYANPRWMSRNLLDEPKFELEQADSSGHGYVAIC